MTQHHPIVPPPEVMERLCTQAGKTWQDRIELAFQAGADAELEACCTEIGNLEWFCDPSLRIAELRAARRPKPPSLEEQVKADIERERQEATDQELEACRQWLEINGAPRKLIDGLLVARCCPEPPSLKEEALQKSTSMMINCHWDGPPPSPHASVNDWFEQEGSKGVLYGLRISALPSRGGNRSPKPLSLKEEAFAALGPEPLPETGPTGDTILNKGKIERHRTIHRALEQLDD